MVKLARSGSSPPARAASIQAATVARGRHGGRPAVIDSDSVIHARALRDAGPPIPEIGAKLTIKTGKNAGAHPSVASVYRALAAASE